MEKTRKVREAMQNIIEKFDINVQESQDVSNEEKYRMKSQRDEHVFYNYKDRRFFDGEKLADQ